MCRIELPTSVLSGDRPPWAKLEGNASLRVLARSAATNAWRPDMTEESTTLETKSQVQNVKP